MDTHTPSGAVRVYQGVLFPTLRVLGEDFSCHTACSLGYIDVSNTEGGWDGNTNSMDPHLIIGCVNNNESLTVFSDLESQ